VRVLLAPDRLGPLPPHAVVQALADGWAMGAPGDVLDVAPLSDGGPGLVAALARAVPGAELLPVVAGGLVAEVARMPGDDSTVVVELAQVLGSGAGDEGVDLAPTSAPAAALLEAAIELALGGPEPTPLGRRLVVGVGGLRAHDAGAGVLAALVAALAAGAGAWPGLARGGAALADLGPGDVAGLASALDEAAARLDGLELVVAVDSEVPLLGLHGASALLAVPGAAALSAAPTEAQRLEGAFGHAVHVLGGELGPGRVRAAAGAHGAGAGGGVAFALGLIGGVLRPAPHVVANLAGLAGRAARADLVVTAATRLDPHSGHDSVLEACARAAEDHAVPVVMLTGDALLGRREWVEQGLAGVYPLDDAPGAARLPAGADDLRALLVARATRVARTWSR
jgi:glycerate kinase